MAPNVYEIGAQFEKIEDDFLSDNGKTESAIESLPYDEPIYDMNKNEGFVFELTHLKFDQIDIDDLIDNDVTNNHQGNRTVGTFIHNTQEDLINDEDEDNEAFCIELVDKGLSPLGFKLDSAFVQTDPCSDVGSKESSSTTEIEGALEALPSKGRQL